MEEAEERREGRREREKCTKREASSEIMSGRKPLTDGVSG